MRAFSLYNLHTAFGIDSKVEEQLQPGISISKPGPLAPLVQAIHAAIVDTGEDVLTGVHESGVYRQENRQPCTHVHGHVCLLGTFLHFTCFTSVSMMISSSMSMCMFM
jgi:hypothetical protein